MARATSPTAATVARVRERDRHACARCGTDRDLTTHHRRNRGMGGSRWPGINLPSNLLTLCGSGTTGCHGWVTAHPLEAREVGLSVSLYREPVNVSVLTWQGLLMLDNDGGARALEGDRA